MKKIVVMSALAMTLSANCDSLFDGLYFGAGAMFGFGQDKASGMGDEVKKNINRFMGSLFLGSGKTMNASPFYFGGEVVLDLSKNKKEDITLKDKSARLTNNGIIPSVGIRMGYAKPDMDILLFAKLGLTYAKGELSYPEGKVSYSKFIPTLAVGIEKSMCQKYTARFDIEYVFSKDKSDGTCKIERGSSLNLRAMIAYNIRF
ncbi:MAG: porin family protein [Alphaproteobacteria bacterium]|nr:porin family protein [Alphaproteobacteria bacterium]